MNIKADVLTHKLIAFITENPEVSSREVFLGVAPTSSYPTIKRALRKLVDEKALIVTGVARATRYSVSALRMLTTQLDADEYFSREIDDRNARVDFNFDLISGQLPKLKLFSDEESMHTEKLHREFQQRIGKLSIAEYKKEFQRLAIDLSWKSAQIEGNTYSLLETERLLLDRETRKR
jgi:hypothetical protein